MNTLKIKGNVALNKKQYVAYQIKLARQFLDLPNNKEDWCIVTDFIKEVERLAIKRYDDCFN